MSAAALLTTATPVDAATDMTAPHIYIYIYDYTYILILTIYIYIYIYIYVNIVYVDHID